MIYLFDTNTVTYFYDRNTGAAHSNVHFKISSLSNKANLAISVLTLYEYAYSCSNSKDLKKRKEIEWIIKRMKEDFSVFPLDTAGAEVFGDLKSTYKKVTGSSAKAMKKHNIDLLLASTAMSNGLILISNDKIFSKLKNDTFFIEDWSLSD